MLDMLTPLVGRDLRDIILEANDKGTKLEIFVRTSESLESGITPSMQR